MVHIDVAVRRKKNKPFSRSINSSQKYAYSSPDVVNDVIVQVGEEYEELVVSEAAECRY